VVSLGSEIEIGDFFSGRRQEYSLELGVRPRPGVALGLEVEHNVLDLAEGSFDTDVFRLRANTQFSPWISLANDVQYDTVSRRLGWHCAFGGSSPGRSLTTIITAQLALELGRGGSRSTIGSRRLVYTLSILVCSASTTGASDRQERPGGWLAGMEHPEGPATNLTRS
jgi:hypothetical protein